MINVDNLLSNILLDLSAKVGKVDLNSNAHIDELYNVLLENDFNSIIANDYIREIKAVISEKRVTREQIKNKISLVFGLEQTSSGNSNDIIEVPKDFDATQFAEDLNNNEELKSELGYESAKITQGRTYPNVVFKLGNIELKYKLSSSKSGASGKEPKAEEYEDGIAVAYNMKQGLSREDAIKKANADPIRMNSTVGDIVLELGNKVVAKLIGPDYLLSMGSSDYSVSNKWPPSNGTPKTDIIGGSNYRISVKKSGGSQLMSGAGGGDNIGVFESALEYYSRYERTNYDAKIKEFINKIKTQFGKVKLYDSNHNIKTDVYLAWLTKRIDNVTEEYNGISPKTIGKTAHKTQIEKHIKAELIDAGYADQDPNHIKWFISGIDNKSNEVNNWFNTVYLRDKHNIKELEKMFNLNMVHRLLQDELTSIFEDKEFKKWVVFEAASGRYKFTGNVAPTDAEPVANKLLIFDSNGMKEPLTTIDEEWAKQFATRVTHQIGFKTTAEWKSSSIRLLTRENTISIFDKLLRESKDDGYSILQERDIGGHRNNVLDGERKADADELFNWLPHGLRSTLKNVIINFFDKIIEHAHKGIKYLATMFDIEIIGSSTVDVIF